MDLAVLADDRSNTSRINSLHSNTGQDTLISSRTTSRFSGKESLQNSFVENVRVWRDPALVLGSTGTVRHINSVQHQTLLMDPSPPPPPSHHPYHHLWKQPTDAARLLREQERERAEQERERLEKLRGAEQAVDKHFEESLRPQRLAQHKQRSNSWSVPSFPANTRVVEDPSRMRDRYFPQHASPVIHPHARLSMKTDSSSQPPYNMFGYPPGYPLPVGMMKVVDPGHHVSVKLPTPPPMISDVKNSVIVKNDAKKRDVYRSSPAPAPTLLIEAQNIQHPVYPTYSHSAAPKVKVSSPAPAHMYGKPSSKLSLSTSPYQQMPTHHPPPVSVKLPPPPPAHSRGAPSVYHGNNSDLSQSQPLDLGMSLVKSEPGVGLSLVTKPPAIEIGMSLVKSEPNIAISLVKSEPNLEISLVKSEPIVNISIVKPESPKRKIEPEEDDVSPAKKICSQSEDTLGHQLQDTTSSDSTRASSPATSISPNMYAISSSNSNNGSCKQESSGSFGAHKLKKAWLQRHSGVESTTPPPATPTPPPITPPPAAPTPPLSHFTVRSTPPLQQISNVASPASSARSTPPLSQVSSDPSPSLASLSTNVASTANSVRSTPPLLLPQNTNVNLSSLSTPPPPTITPSVVPSPAQSSLSVNGNASNSDDSSSSSNEQQKHAPAKLRGKKKNKGSVKSISSNDSDKESDSKSDTGGKKANGNSPNKMSNNGGVKKRGRKNNDSPSDGNSPRPEDSDNGAPNEKKSRDQDDDNDGDDGDDRNSQPNNPFQKPSVSRLKKTGESFLQDAACHVVAPKLAKCRECRWTPNQRSRNNTNIFCRFYGFRRLKYLKNSQLTIAGFSDPYKDANMKDITLWLPDSANPPEDVDLELGRFIFYGLSDQFFTLLRQEEEALEMNMTEDKFIAWKQVVQGVREMCDVCETTLFNFHWTCSKCGFVVCIDCYKDRKNGCNKIWGDGGKDRDDASWLLCNNRQAHEQDKLMLTQIIAADSLKVLGKKITDYKVSNKIPLFYEPNSDPKEEEKKDVKTDSPSNVFADVPLKEQSNNGSEDASNETNVGNSNTTTSKPTEDMTTTGTTEAEGVEREKRFSTLRNLLVRADGTSTVDTNADGEVEEDDNVLYSNHLFFRWKKCLTHTESQRLYPHVPHTWLCDGKLLRLTDPTNPDNYKIFQDVWKRGQPVLVSGVGEKLDKELWHPDTFALEFSDTKADLINCITGNIVPNQSLRRFWEGFENCNKRLKDDKGAGMLLKLKDWPPGEDFAELLPTRYTDLMKVLPLGEYTQRNGRLNLAARLPNAFVKPDLGPKMYIAYGNSVNFSKATTNLHLDVSDAVNLMVYVGVPKDGDHSEFTREMYRAIDDGDADILSKRRARTKGELPGALWHIFQPQDADKIRNCLNKVAINRGAILERNSDPIHDQAWYLDKELRAILYRDHRVKPFTIVQFHGDAVFVPAGAPHQVRNLHSCIKVAEDFVSPENISHCFHLTQEFRNLSEIHTNHEDKLQIKNIIYHAVKDSLSVMLANDEKNRTENQTS